MRCSQHILVFDTNYLYGMANPYEFQLVSATERALVATLERPANNYQRLWFDIDHQGDFLVAGDEFGFIRVWSWALILKQDFNGARTVPPLSKWKAHNGMS